jgi:hypothetical protein
MKRNNNRMNDRKRGGLGRGLEVLLADTESMEALQHQAIAQNVSQMQPAPAIASDMGNERAQLLKEAEALRILMLEFELLVRADLH